MIKAIVFDYGGVIKINDNDLIGKITNYFGITREEWKKEYFSLNYLCNNGQKTFEEVFCLTLLKFNDSKEAKNKILSFLREDKIKFKLNFELIEIIKDLKKRGYQIGLLSNNSMELLNMLKKDNIYDLFKPIIVSAQVGYQKPQPEIFNILFEKLKLKAGEIIFIDDTAESLKGANKIGYIPILYKNNGKLKSDLSTILGITI